MLALSPARVRVLLAALAAGTLPAIPARAQAPASLPSPPTPPPTPPAPERKTMVTLSLLTDQPATPGGTFTLGLRYQIADGWHTYWDGLNDTGMPASWTLELPSGWTAGEAQWPAPKRYGMDNGVVDHVYTGEATILIPISVPAQTAFGDARIAVKSKWLVCQEACIPERGEAEVDVQVIDRPAVRPVPEAIAKARKHAIVAGWGELAATGARAQLQGSELRVTVPGATKLAFFPGKDSSPAEDLVTDGEGAGATLAVAMHQRKGESLVVRGVVEVTRPGATGPVTSWHAIDVTPGVTLGDSDGGASREKPKTKSE